MLNDQSTFRKFHDDEYGELSGAKKWRDDYRCGAEFPLSDGSAAECNPSANHAPCCSSMGWCGKSYINHCSCSTCLDYRRELDSEMT